MKTFFIVLILSISLSVHAQEKDSTFCHYGFVMDYTNSIADEIGFKYRPTKSVAYFFKGNLSTEKPIPFNGVNYSSREYRTYGVTLGIEYGVYSVDKISFYAVIAGGLKISNYLVPYFADPGSDVYMLFIDDRDIICSFTTGLGTEYFFSKHLSISCSQLISLDYRKGNNISEFGVSHPLTHTKVILGNTRFTLSFYF
ncbi:MAG: hypothetical protein M0Q21_10895 [Ignavibacteriaceae bacterium]|nr:hypothetical protein [Ignavibacteriaceae bacterium]